MKENIPHKRRLDLETNDIEIMWIEVRTMQGKLLIGNVYRPPNCDHFWSSFEANVELVKSKCNNAQLLILGDLNADFQTVNGKKLVGMCIVSNLQCHVKEPTRITSNSNTCLDQILSNIPNLILEVKVEPPISTNDHCTVSVIVNFKIAVEKAYERHIWLYKKGDYQGFKNALSQENWDECFNQPSVNVASDTWTEKLLKIAYEFIPNKQIVVRPRDSPWFTSELRGMRRKLLRFYKSAKNTGNTNDWNKYKTLNREYHECLNTAENDYNKK